MLSIGFTIVAHRGSVEFHPYSRRREHAERFLSAVQDESQTLILMGRLHYREDQLLRLRSRMSDRIWTQCQASDAALAQACYRIDGIPGLCRLEGEFVLACYDRENQRLVSLRDPMGHYPLFWVQRGETIALSTSIRPLADHVPELDLDPEYAADYLSFPYENCAALPLAHTAYRGVRRLPPGSLWTANLSTRHVDCRSFWKWGDKVVPVAAGSLQEAGALVRERLEASVRERLSRNARTASHFSGGFDSTGVALLASRLTSEPVHAVSLVYETPPRLAGETEYIQAALDSSPTIVWHPIPAEDLLDYDDQERLSVLDEPSVTGARWHSFAVLARAAAEAGADTLMGGDGADHLFAHAPRSYVCELLSIGKVRQAWRLANHYSYTYGLSARQIMTEAMQQFVPRRLRDGLGPFLRGGRTRFDTVTERTIPPWFTEDFIRRHRLRERILAYQLPLSRSGFLTADALAFSAGDWVAWYAGMPEGVTMSRPYFDPRLLTLGLGLPKWLHAEPGPMKPVLAAALDDILPEKILKRSRKVHFGIFTSGMVRQREALETVIREAPIPDGILDRSVLLDALAKTTLGVYRRQFGVERLRIALSYLMWLSQRAAWKQLPVPGIALLDLCHYALTPD
ncbi:MAG TPA: asparagine synthase-related protein [Bradyrhizobium sp.]|nr:asparagine synthase-related protein [Bradyrhizobium sp.]